MKPMNDDAPLADLTKDNGSIFLKVGIGLACCAFLTLLASGPGVRFGVWPFRTGFAILKYAAYGGMASIVVMLAAIVFAINKEKKINLMAVFVAGVMAITSIAVPYYWQRTAGQFPRIHDISTDVDNPPHFVAILPLRQGAVNPVEYGGAEVAA